MQKNVKFCSINTVNVQRRDDFWLFALSQIHAQKSLLKRGFLSYIGISSYMATSLYYREFQGCFMAVSGHCVTIPPIPL
ncbi:hypothetical protein HMPREF0156_00207 [Bacteroidetes oral taxon 274 str. F0058]|nr:hypothetical protein HMPREF0156_00207 [Bacteroidetes oral taxon 274 str. F0058]